MNKRGLLNVLILVFLFGCGPDFQGGKSYVVEFEDEHHKGDNDTIDMEFQKLIDTIKVSELHVKGGKVEPVICDTIITWF